MDKEEFQKKYDNSILVCCTEDDIKKVFNICDLMDLTASKSKQATAILIGEQTAKSPLFHVKQFLNDFYKEMVRREEKETKMFEQRMNNAIYKLNQKYGNTYIIKGTNMDTVIKCITEIGMNVNLEKERPTFSKGSRIMYTIEDENGNTHTVTRLSKRCYELKECKTLFVTDDEGVVTGIYKEK